MKAADYIEQHGWIRGMMEDQLGRVCALGGLTMVAETATERRIAETVFLRFLRLKYALDDSMSIARWNDQICASKGQVVSDMRECAGVEAMITPHEGNLPA